MSDVITDILDTADGIVNDVVGLKPKEIVARAIDDLGPANLINEITGLEKPGDVIEDLQSKVSPRKLSRGLPSIPKPF